MLFLTERYASQLAENTYEITRSLTNERNGATGERRNTADVRGEVCQAARLLTGYEVQDEYFWDEGRDWYETCDDIAAWLSQGLEDREGTLQDAVRRAIGADDTSGCSACIARESWYGACVCADRGL